MDEQHRRASPSALHVKSPVVRLYEPRTNAHLVLHLVEFHVASIAHRGIIIGGIQQPEHTANTEHRRQDIRPDAAPVFHLIRLPAGWSDTGAGCLAAREARALEMAARSPR